MTSAASRRYNEPVSGAAEILPTTENRRMNESAERGTTIMFVRQSKTLKIVIA